MRILVQTNNRKAYASNYTSVNNGKEAHTFNKIRGLSRKDLESVQVRSV